jgi:hypothetical protein
LQALLVDQKTKILDNRPVKRSRLIKTVSTSMIYVSIGDD